MHTLACEVDDVMPPLEEENENTVTVIEDCNEDRVVEEESICLIDPNIFSSVVELDTTQRLSPISKRFLVNSCLDIQDRIVLHNSCLLYTSPSPRDRTRSRMPSSA